jgi:hypothetical protein
MRRNNGSRLRAALEWAAFAAVVALVWIAVPYSAVPYLRP